MLFLLLLTLLSSYLEVTLNLEFKDIKVTLARDLKRRLYKLVL